MKVEENMLDNGQCELNVIFDESEEDEQTYNAIMRAAEQLEKAPDEFLRDVIINGIALQEWD